MLCFTFTKGLSAATILARDAIGDNKGNGLPKREYGSFDTLQSGKLLPLLLSCLFFSYIEFELRIREAK